MTHGSLFSGIGGFDLAAEWAGFENLFHCELNPFCRQVLKHHFQNSESYEDITKTDFTKWQGKIDVITGGFPCQPFSVAGSRKGTEDDRYLWPQMLRAIEEIRPTWVIGENVAGILSMVLPGEEIEVGGYTDITGENYKEVKERQLYIIERICQDFECIEYSIQPVVIPACSVGAPHRRDRIWFIANSNGKRDTSCRTCEEIERCGRSHVSQQGKWGNTTKRIDELLRLYADASDTNCEKLETRIRNKKWKDYQKVKTRVDIRTERSCCLQSSPNTNKLDDKLSGLCSGEFSKQQATRIFENIPDWRNFPTQSPVCNRDDGVSLKLAGISFPKWRQESIKALGNAIVPQVAYEIFKAIKIIETI